MGNISFILHKKSDFLNILNFLNFKKKKKKKKKIIFCDVRLEGWVYAHIWEMGVSMALYGDAKTPRVFELTEKPPSLLLISAL
jgi:hypothetical protein